MYQGTPITNIGSLLNFFSFRHIAGTKLASIFVTELLESLLCIIIERDREVVGDELMLIKLGPEKDWESDARCYNLK